VLLITHYTRILRYIAPDFVHVFIGGRIVEEGGRELADELETNGYAKYGADARPAATHSLPAGPLFGGAVTPA
jgi:Fe-S cluster assembly ATP-binding protein